MGFPLAGPDDDISELLSRNLLQQHSESKGYHFAFSKTTGTGESAYDVNPSHSIIDSFWDKNQPCNFLDHPSLMNEPIPLPYIQKRSKVKKN